MAKPTDKGLNRENPFEHTGRCGTKIKAPRMDMQRCTVRVEWPKGASSAQLVRDIAEIMTWWTLNVYPRFLVDGLGHAGTDTIDFDVVRV